MYISHHRDEVSVHQASTLKTQPDRLQDQHWRTAILTDALQASCAQCKGTSHHLTVAWVPAASDAASMFAAQGWSVAWHGCQVSHALRTRTSQQTTSPGSRSQRSRRRPREGARAEGCPKEGFCIKHRKPSFEMQLRLQPMSCLLKLADPEAGDPAVQSKTCGTHSTAGIGKLVVTASH